MVVEQYGGLGSRIRGFLGAWFQACLFQQLYNCDSNVSGLCISPNVRTYGSWMKSCTT